MTSLEDAIAFRDARQSKAAEIMRQLSLAGLGVIWIFKTQDASGNISIDRSLTWAGLLIVFAMAIDLLQAVGSALVMDWALERVSRWSWNEKNHYAEVEVMYPRYWVCVLQRAFYLKFAILAIAYVIVLSFLANQLLF